ncbi:hypothetical protein FB451DRAFT_1167889 [Mycena latifolia]|nr:hypothetical protein FB451DRAFT_1167889 [Mycena latifolia]
MPRFGGPHERSEGGEGYRMVGPLRAHEGNIYRIPRYTSVFTSPTNGGRERSGRSPRERTGNERRVPISTRPPSIAAVRIHAPLWIRIRIRAPLRVRIGIRAPLRLSTPLAPRHPLGFPRALELGFGVGLHRVRLGAVKVAPAFVFAFMRTVRRTGAASRTRAREARKARTQRARSHRHSFGADHPRLRLEDMLSAISSAKCREYIAGPFAQGGDAETRTYASTTEVKVVGCVRGIGTRTGDDGRGDGDGRGGRTGGESVSGDGAAVCGQPLLSWGTMAGWRSNIHPIIRANPWECHPRRTPIRAGPYDDAVAAMPLGSAPAGTFRSNFKAGWKAPIRASAHIFSFTPICCFFKYGSPVARCLGALPAISAYQILLWIDFTWPLNTIDVGPRWTKQATGQRVAKRSRWATLHNRQIILDSTHGTVSIHSM